MHKALEYCPSRRQRTEQGPPHKLSLTASFGLRRGLSALAALRAGLHLAVASAQTGRAERGWTNALARCVLARAVGKTCVSGGVRKSQLADTNRTGPCYYRSSSHGKQKRRE
jgi:hypothetical protein